MNRDSDDALERALSSYLDGAAPAPRADALPRIKERVASASQHSAWRVRAARMVSSLVSARQLATVAVVGGALLVGVLIGQVGRPTAFGPQPSASGVPMPVSTPAASSWEEPDSYSYVLEGCGPNLVGVFRIYVTDGVAIAFDMLDERAESYDGHTPAEMPTLGRIMAWVAEAQSLTELWPLPAGPPPPSSHGVVERSLPEVRLTTDPDDGHPVDVFIDWIPEAIDDELCYSIRDFDVAGGDPAGEAIGEATAVAGCLASRAASDYEAGSVYRAEWSSAGEVVAWQEGRHHEVAPTSDLRAAAPGALVLVCIYRGEFVTPAGPPQEGVAPRGPTFLRVLVLEDGEYLFDSAGPDGSLEPETPSDWREAHGDITQAALDLAVSDERLIDLLATHPYQLDVVRPAGPLQDVYISFDEPIASSDWPLDFCDAAAATGPIDGIHWRVDVSAQVIEAVSPRWGSFTCLSVS